MTYYVAWCRYGSSRNGCDNYLSLHNDGTYDIDCWARPALFKTIDVAKAVVTDWCAKKRESLLRVGLHSGKTWNQTAPGAWHYREVNLQETPKILRLESIFEL